MFVFLLMHISIRVLFSVIMGLSARRICVPKWAERGVERQFSEGWLLSILGMPKPVFCFLVRVA